MKYLFVTFLFIFSFNAQANIAFELPKQPIDTTAPALKRSKAEKRSDSRTLAIITTVSFVGTIVALVKFEQTSNACGTFSQSCPENVLPGLIGILFLILTTVFGIATLISLAMEKNKKKIKK